MNHQGGLLPSNKTEESTDSRQSGIAGSGTATPRIFDMIEEVEHERFVDAFHRKFLNIFVQRVGSIAQQQLNGIAISQNGIGCKAFLNRQIVAKEGPSSHNPELHITLPSNCRSWKKGESQTGHRRSPSPIYPPDQLQGRVARPFVAGTVSSFVMDEHYLGVAGDLFRRFAHKPLDTVPVDERQDIQRVVHQQVEKFLLPLRRRLFLALSLSPFQFPDPLFQFCIG